MVGGEVQHFVTSKLIQKFSKFQLSKFLPQSDKFFDPLTTLSLSQHFHEHFYQWHKTVLVVIFQIHDRYFLKLF